MAIFISDERFKCKHGECEECPMLQYYRSPNEPFTGEITWFCAYSDEAKPGAKGLPDCPLRDVSDSLVANPDILHWLEELLLDRRVTKELNDDWFDFLHKVNGNSGEVFDYGAFLHDAYDHNITREEIFMLRSCLSFLIKIKRKYVGMESYKKEDDYLEVNKNEF